MIVELLACLPSVNVKDLHRTTPWLTFVTIPVSDIHLLASQSVEELRTYTVLEICPNDAPKRVKLEVPDAKPLENLTFERTDPSIVTTSVTVPRLDPEVNTILRDFE